MLPEPYGLIGTQCLSFGSLIKTYTHKAIIVDGLWSIASVGDLFNLTKVVSTSCLFLLHVVVAIFVVVVVVIVVLSALTADSASLLLSPFHVQSKSTHANSGTRSVKHQ